MYGKKSQMLTGTRNSCLWRCTGSILWPENQAKLNDAQKDKMLNKIPLNKQGSPEDIANTVLLLHGFLMGVGHECQQC
jgi:NAD(P)-dependent dehydrogenase (short-subunit alcohol dehydrogenase family)